MGDHQQLDLEIAVHYASVSEQQRLGPWSPERVRTWELLGRHLPPPPAVVLDIGGAAGVYALPLAAQGYQVHLIDPLALHVQQALRASAEQPAAPLASATVGDARQLDRPDASVDAALLFGPLYHLTDRADRIRALVEARRVLRPGGVLAAAAISRFASTLDGLLRGYLDEPGFEAIVERDLRDGQHRNPTGRPEWFTTAYFHLPEELAQEVGEAGLRLHALLAVEGPAWMLPTSSPRGGPPMPRRWKAAIFLTTLLAATLSLATFASARTDHVTVLHFTARQVELHFVDVAPTGGPPSPRRHLRGQRRPVPRRPQGRLQRRHLSCRAHPARPVAFRCVATAHLDQGDLTVQGLAFQQPTNVFGITGGTGRWRNAGGQVVVQDVLQPTSQITAYVSDLGQGHS